MATKLDPKLALPKQPVQPVIPPQQVLPSAKTNPAPAPEITTNIVVSPAPKKKGGFFKKLLIFIILIIILGGTAAGAYYYFNFIYSSEPVLENLETVNNISGEFYDLKITSVDEQELADFEVVVGGSKMYFRPKVFYIDFNYKATDWVELEYDSSEDFEIFIEESLKTAFSELGYEDIVLKFQLNEFTGAQELDVVVNLSTFYKRISESVYLIAASGDPKARDAQRKFDLNVIVSAVSQYKADHSGLLPDEDGNSGEDSFPIEPTCIGKAPQCWKLETAGLETGDTLIPNYLDEYLMDPVTGHVQDTGYTIQVTENGQVIATAKGELEETIIVER